MHLFLSAQGLHCCSQAFSSFGIRDYSPSAVHRLLAAVASPIAKHRF